jgi:hypothetical protein
MFLSCLGLVLAPWPLRKQLGLFLFVVDMPGSLGRHGNALSLAPDNNEPLDSPKKTCKRQTIQLIHIHWQRQRKKFYTLPTGVNAKNFFFRH